MSGRYQIHTGLQHGIIQNSQKSCEPTSDLVLFPGGIHERLFVLAGLPPKFGTMADAFKSGGYATHMIVSPMLTYDMSIYCPCCCNVLWRRHLLTGRLVTARASGT